MNSALKYENLDKLIAYTQWGSNMTFTEKLGVSKTLEILITLKFTPYGVRNFLVFMNLTNRTRDMVS